VYFGRDFSPLETPESRVVGLDFVNDINKGDTLLSSTWDVLVVAGVDPSPMVLQGPSVEVIPRDSDLKTVTIQRVGGCLPGVRYRLRAQVTTSLGNTVSGWSHIQGIGSNT